MGWAKTFNLPDTVSVLEQVVGESVTVVMGCVCCGVVYDGGGDCDMYVGSECTVKVCECVCV